ncbi:MAG: hypothetical protein ACYTGL_12905 [Planctomycetota bacterium]|jgi:hypothetical protein
MFDLLEKLVAVVIAVWELAYELIAQVLPWSPLLFWVAFWLLAVNWVKFRGVLIKGGWTGVAFIYVMMILIWGLIAPPEGGAHSIFQLQLSNFVGKTVYTTALFSIMFICGSVQLAGTVDRFTCFKEDEEPEPAHAH